MSIARRGFTIVELLIVVVVIAVLAAITIISYNGINQRAKESAAASTASQAAKKISSELITNTDHAPEDIALIGLKSENGVTYQYSRDISVIPNTFCVTATTNNISYFATSGSASPQKGACPGHGIDGVEAITNMAMNPRITNWMVGSSYGFRVTTGRWFGGGGGAGVYSLETGTTPIGNTFGRKTWTAAPTANNGDTGFNGGTYNVTAGETFTFSAYLRSSSWKWHEIGINTYDIDTEDSTRRRSPSVLLSPNVWTRVSWTYTVHPNVNRIMAFIDMSGSTSGAGTHWAVGDTLDITGYMVTQGSTLHTFADGNSSNWVWNGGVDTSTSTGTPL